MNSVYKMRFGLFFVLITCGINAWVLTPLLCAQSIRQIGVSPQGPIIRASVNPQLFAKNYQDQIMPEWCWAASISNIFAYYGHSVRQDRVVQAVYGTVVNLPALAARVIATEVNRPWIDDHGTKFQSHLTAAYDAQAGVLAINNFYIINELRQGHPLLVCNTHHCMVVTAVDYTPAQVLQVWVFDPFPGSPQVHALPPIEAIPAHQGGQLTFVGALTVR
jgi:hypothetical protein